MCMKTMLKNFRFDKFDTLNAHLYAKLPLRAHKTFSIEYSHNQKTNFSYGKLVIVLPISMGSDKKLKSEY